MLILLRCLATSYRAIAVATDAFRLSNTPLMGIAATSVAIVLTDFLRPLPSEPTMITVGPLKSTDASGTASAVPSSPTMRAAREWSSDSAVSRGEIGGHVLSDGL